MQKLILPLNKATVSASFMNSNYFRKFKFNHYGTDMFGDNLVWSCGNGVILDKGFDELYGNFCSVLYPNCESKLGGSADLIFNFFHMASLADWKIGKVITSDARLGIIGNTGKYTTGTHLHVECYPMTENGPYSGFGSDHFKVNPHYMLNPLYFLYVKSSKPDFQSIKWQGETYTNAEDRRLIYEYES